MLRFLLFAMPIDVYTCQARHGSGKKYIINFLDSARLENSKQCKEDAQFLAGYPQIYMFFSTVVAVVFPPLSMTEVIGICNFVQKRMLTLVCLAVWCCYHKIDKNNQVDVNNLLASVFTQWELLSRYLLCKACIQITEKKFQRMRINFY